MGRSVGSRVVVSAVLLITLSYGTRGDIAGPPAGQPLDTSWSSGSAGPVDPATSIDFALALRSPDPAAVNAHLAELYDPHSTSFRQFLTPAQFGARFGPDLTRLEGVAAWAADHGLSVLGGYDHRSVLRLRASAGQLHEVFGVDLGTFVDAGSGRSFRSPLGAATVPGAIADVVAGLTGLDTRPAWPRSLPPTATPRADVPPKGLGRADLAKAYDIEPLYHAGYQGDGQTVAIVSFDTFNPSDIATFDAQSGIDGPSVERVAVGPRIGSPGRGAAEVTLDIEIARAVAPHARILNFEAVNGSGQTHGDMIDAILQDGRADIISDSWGLCDVDEHFGTGSRERQLRSLQAAAAAGVNVFAPSGDTGAFDCWSRDHSDHRATVDFPSGSPYTISVGGTVLSVRTDGAYFAEAGWEEFLSTRASGGGMNPSEPRPAWQRGPGVDNAASKGRRQVPDVAAAAGDDSPYQIYYTPGDGTAPWTTASGTSAAAPFWAGVAVLLREVAQHEGVGRLGYLNPILYELAAGDQTRAVFHDVTVGGNLLHQATPGWDDSTGLGSPDVTALARAIVTYLRANPAGL